ncbi:MAG: hypothetical protein QNJ03_02870 [Dinoroseobacter sp.]|nr:hypothetical protein [Dinoroseobacter sp.]
MPAINIFSKQNPTVYTLRFRKLLSAKESRSDSTHIVDDQHSAEIKVAFGFRERETKQEAVQCHKSRQNSDRLGGQALSDRIQRTVSLPEKQSQFHRQKENHQDSEVEDPKGISSSPIHTPKVDECSFTLGMLGRALQARGFMLILLKARSFFDAQ